jgi:hypothetical protein
MATMVEKLEMAIVTAVVPIRFVIKRRSFCALIFLSVAAPNRRFFTADTITWSEIAIRGISVPAKNIKRRRSVKNILSDAGSITKRKE